MVYRGFTVTVTSHEGVGDWVAEVVGPDGSRWESGLFLSRWGARRAARRWVRSMVRGGRQLPSEGC